MNNKESRRKRLDKKNMDKDRKRRLKRPKPYERHKTRSVDAKSF